MTRSARASSVGRPLLLAGALVAALAPAARAGSADDDLQAVKKAVLSSSGSQRRPPAEDPGIAAEPKPQPHPGEQKWLRVRVVEKAGGHARVSVSLPLGLVRAFGEDWPIPVYHGCRKRERCGPTLGEILRALDSGQSLVEIEGDGASIRVWVD